MISNRRQTLRSAGRWLLRLSIWAMIVASVWWLWPTRFGGPTTVALVHGDSMEPTYSNGDLVVARQNERYRPGEVVVFKVKLPGKQAASALVVHRLLAIGDDGTVITQGDNRTTADSFPLTTGDIVGRSIAHIPRGGVALRILSSWWLLGSTSGMLITIHLWPEVADREQEWNRLITRLKRRQLARWDPRRLC